LNVSGVRTEGDKILDLSFLDSILENYRQQGYYPSAVCQVFDEQHTLYHKAFGNVAPNTWYDLASVSKIICTTMALSFMEEGKLSPETLVLCCLPEDGPGPVAQSRLRNVTVLQLMTHTSGLMPWYPFYTDGRDFYTVLEKALLSGSPETGMAYSDLNFILLGLIVCRLSGLTLPQALEKYIKDPLNISNISYGPINPFLAAPSCCGNQIEKRMCAERGLTFDGWRPDGIPVRGTCNDGNAYYFWHGASGHAGVFANSAALTKLCQYYMNTKSLNFLNAVEMNICGRGLGFDKSDVFPDGCGHSGFTGTSLWFSKKHHIGAVLLTNKYYRNDDAAPGNSNEFRRAVHYGLLNKKLELENIVRPEGQSDRQNAHRGGH
jgi:serine-type D-Ala-D-Ala carboxypeptidase